MDIQALRSVILLSKKLNFTQTAEAMNIAQPALSRKIAQLEQEVNAPLFFRNKRNVKLTLAGSYFIDQVEELVNKLDHVVNRTGQIDRGEAGELRIGFTHSVMQSILPDLLKKIRGESPDLKTILKEMNNRDQYSALQSGNLDLGFATNPLVPSNLKSKVLHVDNYVVLLPQSHPVNNGNYQEFSVFAKDSFILPSPSDGPNYVRIIESICLEAGFSPNIVHETDSASTSFKLVEAGMGISLEPISSIQGYESHMNVIELKDIPQKAELTMIWNPQLEDQYPNLFELIGGSL